MIAAVILDVDGVVKGSQEGINYPLPHTDIIQAMKTIHKNGIPIILCSGNYYSSIVDIIRLANLHNPHITDRGALIINPLDHQILEKDTIRKNMVKRVLGALAPLHNYLEVYADHAYFIQKNLISSLTKKRSIILRQEPVIVDSLMQETEKEDIIKINVFATNHEEKQQSTQAIEPFSRYISTAWVGNPAIGTIEVMNITAKGITKMHACGLVLKKLGLSFDQVLGVGDSMSDWEFMESCAYVAAMGNASDTLKEIVQTKPKGNYFLAPHVDENGLLDVFRHFSLY